MRVAISVIMSVFNEEECFLREAVNSILGQTFSDFEFIIVDDCCNEKNKRLLLEIQNLDSRVKVIQNKENLGLTKSLNKAIKVSNGKYIARMDSDDVSLPERFIKQIEFLEKNPHVDMLGGITIDYDSHFYDHGYLTDNIERLGIRFLFMNAAFGHPTVMIRKKFLDRVGLEYDESYTKSQDYGLWVDAVANGGVLKSLNEVIVLKRVHQNQISTKNHKEQSSIAVEIRRRLWKKYGFNIDAHDLGNIITLTEGQYTQSTGETIRKILKQSRLLTKTKRKYFEEELMLYFFFATRLKRHIKLSNIDKRLKFRILKPNILSYFIKRIMVDRIKINKAIRHWRIK